MADTWATLNKDNDWVNLGASADFRCKFDEAIVTKPSDDYLVVYAYLTEAKDVKQTSDNKTKSGKEWKLPAPCYFKIPLREFETEYQGNKKKHPQTKGHQIISAKLLEFGLDKPFKGLIDLNIVETLADTLLTKAQPDGQPLSPDMEKFVLSSYLAIEPIESLGKLEKDKLPSVGGGKSNWSGGGSKGQKESEILADRFSFLKAELAVFNEGKPLADMLEITSLMSGLEDKQRSNLITLMNTIIK